MIINVNKWWKIIINYYFSNTNYDIHEDPSLTYDEFLIIYNIGNIVSINRHEHEYMKPIEEINTIDFIYGDQVWEENYVAHFFNTKELSDIEIDKILKERCNKNNISRDKHGFIKTHWKDNPKYSQMYLAEKENKSKKNYYIKNYREFSKKPLEDNIPWIMN